LIKKRVIPCLYVKDGRVVKGIQFHPEKSGTYGLEILNQALKGGFIND